MNQQIINEIKAKYADKINSVNAAGVTCKNELLKLRQDFIAGYGPGILISLSGQDLAVKLFGDKSCNGLFYKLEHDTPFGSGHTATQRGILAKRGGSSYVFNYYQKGPKLISASDAIIAAEELRNNIIEINSIISSNSFNTVQDYIDVNDMIIKKCTFNSPYINSYIGKNNVMCITLIKYFHILHPDKIGQWYSSTFMGKLANILGITFIQSNNSFVRNGEILTGIYDGINNMANYSQSDKGDNLVLFDAIGAIYNLHKNSSLTSNSGGSIVSQPTNTRKEHELNLILYGPPGTGKTYNSVIHAVAIIERKDVNAVVKEDYKKVLARFNYYKGCNKIVFTTFHQSYDYEEFIQGIKPVIDKKSGTVIYDIVDGIFKELCDKAKERAEEKCSLGISRVHVEDDIKVEAVEYPDRFVIIIDEINRGNISKIFGELITLIEPKKRLGAPEAMTCKLPYNKEDFGVPNNVYIIGTMNTADRSLVQLDTALRRRFAFKEMMPNYDILKSPICGINIADVLRAINERITALIDREHQIGHSYFTDLTAASTVDELADIFRDKIIPLLQEYFFDDYEKIKDVLNDNGFIESVTPTYKVNGANNTIYKIDETALGIADNYIKIYDGNQNSTTSANGGLGNNQGSVTSSANGSGGNQSGNASTNGGSDGGEVEE